MNTEERERVVIKPAELRVGNWFNDVKGGGYNNPSYQQVRSIGSRGINEWQDMGASGCVLFENVQPIVLSPEILEKAGFKKTYDSDFQTKYELLGDTSFEYTIRKERHKHFLSWYNNPIPCDFLHHLQNIVFDLSGFELTFKNDIP